MRFWGEIAKNLHGCISALSLRGLFFATCFSEKKVVTLEKWGGIAWHVVSSRLPLLFLRKVFLELRRRRRDRALRREGKRKREEQREDTRGNGRNGSPSSSPRVSFQFRVVSPKVKIFGNYCEIERERESENWAARGLTFSAFQFVAVQLPVSICGLREKSRPDSRLIRLIS